MENEDVPPVPTLVPENSSEEDNVEQAPPQKKKRVMTPKQLEALEAGRAKRREAQLAKSAAKRAELEARSTKLDDGVEEQKGEETTGRKTRTTKKTTKKLESIEEKLNTLIDREMSKSKKKSRHDDEEDEDEEVDSLSESELEEHDDEEEEHFLQQQVKRQRPNKKVTTPAMEHVKNETDKYRRYLNRTDISFF